MKIVQICSHYDYGGAAKIAASLHRGLLERGYESRVAFGRGKGTDEEGLYRFDREGEILVSAFLSRLVGLNGWWNHGGTRRLLRYLEKEKPDIIHLHIIHGYYLNFYMLFSYLNEKRIPCVWTFHDCHAFVGNCGYFMDCRRWETGCGKCPRLREYPVSQFFDFTAYMWREKKKLFTGGRKILVTPSKWLAGEVKKSFLKEFECVTIPNGIDTEGVFYPRDRALCRRKYGFREQEKLVLGIAVSYQNPVKGASYLVDLARELGEQARVILIGWDPKMDHKLRGLDNVVTMPAISDREELAEFYSLADVFVLPSLAENYATVVLEAQACGTPVVGFATGGTTEQLAQSRGIAVEKGNCRALVEGVKQVLFRRELLPQREELAAYAAGNHSLDKMLDSYLEIYERLRREESAGEEKGRM